jgi:hypothetical protein
MIEFVVGAATAMAECEPVPVSAERGLARTGSGTG